ncbi:MAG: ABC transporter substrate-binding protein [Sedimentibacter sp.]
MAKISLRVKTLKVISIILVMLVLIAGCGQNTPSTPQKTPATGNENVNTNAEKIIRMGVAGTPKIDPAVATDAASVLAMVNIYDSLVYPNEDGTLRPQLAERWEISDNSLEYTFFLRKGVKFHNGDEMKASDVEYSANRLITIGEGFAYMFKNTIKNIEVIDDYTIKFTLNNQFGPFLNTLIRLYILDEDQVKANTNSTGNYGENGDYGRDWLLTHDAGSGPYTVTELKQQQHVIAVKFEDYWSGWDNADAPDTIRLVDSSEPATTRTMIENRELEITDEYQSVENISAMSKIPGVSVGIYSSGGVQNMMYNNKKAPTDDVNFRKALNYMLDYNMVSEKVFVDSPVAVGPVAAGVPGSNLNLEKFEYNIDKAKEFLAKSKYAGKLDQYPVEFLINSTVPDQEKIALALQATAQQLGVKVEISKGPWLSIVEQVANLESTPNILCTTVSPSYFDAGSMLMSRYHSNSTGSWEQGEWLQDEKFDKMLEEAMKIVDSNERYEEYYKIQKYLVNDVTPSGWLVDLVKRCVYQSDYVYWPAAESAKEGKIVTLPLGYSLNFSEFKVYPEKINK